MKEQGYIIRSKYGNCEKGKNQRDRPMIMRGV